MVAGAFSGALWTLLGSLVVFVGILVYATLVRQISARTAAPLTAASPVPARTFELPEAVLAALVVSWFLVGITWSVGHRSTEMTSRNLLEGLLLMFTMICVVAGWLKLRGFDLDSLAGFSRASLKRALSTAVILLLAAMPLIFFAEALTQKFLGGESSKQEIVDLFTGSQTIGQRITIIVLAVVVAPISEEFIFRFFIYGVVRRYFGIAVALIFNSLLFAAAHTHLPSAAPLFVLGACFTLAYEWSGSILVSMGMHTLFNSTQLIFLAFPDLIRQ